MKIGTIIRSKQPGVYRKLNEKLKRRRDKQEHLSFSYCRNMMEEGHVYRSMETGEITWQRDGQRLFIIV